MRQPQADDPVSNFTAFQTSQLYELVWNFETENAKKYLTEVQQFALATEELCSVRQLRPGSVSFP